MIKSRGKRAAYFCFALMVLILSSCATEQVKPVGGKEVWITKITGGASGYAKFFIKQEGNESDIYSVTGRMQVEAQYDWQSVSATIDIRGKLKKTIFNAKLIERAETGKGFSGTMFGAMSKTQAFGTWTLSSEFGDLHGGWTAEKKK